MRIVITGANGQVGAALCVLAKHMGYEPIPLSRDHWDMALNPAFGESLIQNIKPDLVISSAAYTNVDEAEDNEETAFLTNAVAPKYLARGCKGLNIPIFHISTDYVFDGLKAEPYNESDHVNPINVYGRTKLAGELAIKEEIEKCIILRISWVFSKEGRNFVNTITELAKSRDLINVIDDQIGGPVSAVCVANVLMQLAGEHKERWGTYHYSGMPFVSWFEFSKVILANINKPSKEGVNVKIQPCSSSEYPTRARRPSSSMLSCKLIRDRFGIVPCEWKQYLT